MSQIQLINVTKVYKNNEVALRDINLKINRGEFVYITGPSGSGKTTLLKLLYKDETYEEGKIYVLNRNLKKQSKKKLRRNLGFVFQNFELISNKTVYENVAYPLQILGENPFRIKKKVLKILEEVGLESHIHKKPNELSGGQQQRVSIARAMVINPRIIICDEPTGNLDIENSDKIIELLEKLNKKGITIIVTTHDKRLIDKYANRVIILEEGRIEDDKEVTPENKNDLEEKLSIYFSNNKNHIKRNKKEEPSEFGGEED